MYTPEFTRVVVDGRQMWRHSSGRLVPHVAGGDVTATPDPRIELRAGVEYVRAELERLQEITRTEGAEPLTEEQWASIDAGIDYVKRTEAQIARYDRLEEAALVTRTPSTGGPSIPAPNINRGGDPFDLSTLPFDATREQVRGRAVTAIERVGHLDDDQRQHVTRMVESLGGELIGRVLATGSETYRSAAMKLMTNQAHMLNPAEQAAITRAQSLTDAAGGFAVPFTLDPTIMLTNAGTQSPLRQIARTETIVTNAWNGVNSAGATATYKAEAAEATDDSITIAQPDVPVHRLDIFVPFSVEIGQDWPSFEASMREVMNDAKTRRESTAFTVGSGNDEPTGFITALDGTASELSPATAETFAVDDVYEMENDLGDRFLDNASFVAHRAIYNLIRQFDTSGGADLWARLGAGQPPELIGYPAYRSSDMDSGFNPAATADNFILAFGDFRAGFLIVDRVGMNFELVPHLLATANNRPSGQRGFWAWCRNGSDVVNTAALRVLNVATTA